MTNTVTGGREVYSAEVKERHMVRGQGSPISQVAILALIVKIDVDFTKRATEMVPDPAL
jgi:hypothetical protein